MWAPRASAVELVLDGSSAAMTAGENGWWHADAVAAAGTRYGFRLDGGPVRPDPRALDQPDGIDALSAVFDHEHFAWSDAAWSGVVLRGAVLYELHVGTFTPAGTFDAAIERLDHLVDLGITAVEVMPVATFSGDRGWGYDGVQLFAVHPAYGGPDAMKRFVDGCHRRGLGVIVDVVYNHLGPAGNHLGAFGPYFTDRHQTPWGDAVNVDGPDAGEVRRFIIDNACMWIRDFHADGLRLDAVHEIIDDSGQHLLAELTGAVRAAGAATGRTVVVIAESDRNDPAVVTPPPQGLGLDGVWSDDWHHALHTVLTGEQDGYYADYGAREDLEKALRQAWVYDGRWSEHLQRRRGGSTEGVAPSAFVIAAQTHDQVGNRAVGERLSMLVPEGRARLAAALLLTAPFTPMLFQGEEWGSRRPFLYFTDHHDPQLGEAVSKGRRAEFAAFGWKPDDVPDPQAEESYRRSQLDWAEPDQPEHRAVLDWYRALVGLRRSLDPAAPCQASFTGDVLEVRRAEVTILGNLGEQAVPIVTEGEVILAWPPDGRDLLPPDGVVVVRGRVGVWGA